LILKKYIFSKAIICNKVLLFSLLILLFTPETKAQKVAVVLSGGGADGLSHIGVLKSLEQNHIPIDYIAGTSMGALVGGLYAAGYSIAEIEAFAKSEKFQLNARGDIEEKYVYFFKKKSPDASWINFKFSPDTILRTSIPTNLVSPVPIDFNMMELFSNATASSKNNFDSLFIPFRCVATDITSKSTKVFSTGNLGQSIRASLSYPFYLKPLNIDNHLFFDGGLYNNFPIDIADKEFLPDIIIGSTVSENMQNPSEDDILSQLKSMVIDRKPINKINAQLILIEPRPNETSLFNFSQTPYLIEKGYEATELKMQEILQKVKRRVDGFELFCKREQFKYASNRLIFEELNITGIKKSQSKYVRRLLLKRGKLISIDELRPKYFRLSADEKINQIYPTATLNPQTGYYKLNLKIKKEKDVFIAFGGNFSSRPINAAYIGAQYNYLGNFATTISANSYFGKFYGSYQVKAKFDIPFSLPFYTELSFTRNRFDFFRSATTFFEDVKPSYLVQNENFGSLEFALPVKNKSRILAGTSYANMYDEYYQNRSFKSSDTSDITSFDNYSVYFGFERNTLNKKQYANSGTYLGFRARYLVGEQVNTPGSTSNENSIDVFSKFHTWYQFKFTYETYYKRRGKIRLGVFTEAVVSDQDFFNNYTATILASPFFAPIPESKTRFIPKFRTHNYAAFGLRNVINIFKTLDFRLEGFAFQPYKEILRNDEKQAFYGQPFSKLYFVASSSIVYHSPVGPLSLSFNYFDQEPSLNKAGVLANKPVYGVLFSFGYILFNKRALE
jgi:NTE family protein